MHFLLSLFFLFPRAKGKLGAHLGAAETGRLREGAQGHGGGRGERGHFAAQYDVACIACGSTEPRQFFNHSGYLMKTTSVALTLDTSARLVAYYPPQPSIFVGLSNLRCTALRTLHEPSVHSEPVHFQLLRDRGPTNIAPHLSDWNTLQAGADYDCLR